MEDAPVSEGSFYYGRHGFQVEVSGSFRETGAADHEIQAMPSDYRPLHWWQAQCMHYGLDWPTNRAQGHGNLMWRSNAGTLEIPQRIQLIEQRLRAQWEARHGREGAQGQNRMQPAIADIPRGQPEEGQALNQDRSVFTTHTGVVHGSVNNNYYASANPGPAPQQRKDNEDGVSNQQHIEPSDHGPAPEEGKDNDDSLDTPQLDKVSRNRSCLYELSVGMLLGHLMLDICPKSVFRWVTITAEGLSGLVRINAQSAILPHCQRQSDAVWRVKDTERSAKAEYSGVVRFSGPNEKEIEKYIKFCPTDDGKYMYDKGILGIWRLRAKKTKGWLVNAVDEGKLQRDWETWFDD